MWHRQQESAHGSWTRWKQHGQPPNAQEILTLMEMNLDGRLELITTVHTPLPQERFEMWRLRQKSPHGPWSQWELATDPTDPGQRYGPRAVCRGADGRLLAFGTLFGSMEVGHTSQGVPGGDWQPWASLGNPGGRPVSAVAAVVDRSGLPNVLALASDTSWEGPYRVWHLHQAGPDGSWSGWSPLGAPVAGIGSSGDGRRGLDRQRTAHLHGGDGRSLWNRWLPAHGSQWSPWQTMGHPASTTQIFSPSVCTAE